MTPLHRVPPALLIGLALVTPAAGASHAAAAAGASCAARVAVLGADLTPAGRVAVRQTLGLGPGEAALTESLADERAQAHGLIPPALLGVVAVSSVVLRPVPAGSGLRVTLDRNVTLYPAQAYANALLTAGVSDAAVSIAAPATQRALGTTALLGLLRAARLSCGATNAARQDLAVHEFVLTDALSARTGYAAAPLLMARLKSDATTGHVTAPGALATLVDADAARLGTTVPLALRPAVVAYLHDLTAARAYDDVAAARPTFGGAVPLQAAVSFARPLGQASPVAPAAASPAGMVYHGAAAAGASATALAVRPAGGPVGSLRLFSPAADAPVYRDGARVVLAAIQRGDTVTVMTDAAGRVTRIDAVSHNGASAGTVIRGTLPGVVTGSALAVRQGAGTRAYRAAPGVRVYRDGRPSALAALHPNDHVVVTTNAAGAVTRIDATSAGAGAAQGGAGHGAVTHGTATTVAATAAAVTLTEADGPHTYRTAPGAAVYRDGKSSTLTAIQPGDNVTVTTDASGRAVRIDATSHAGTTGGVARGTVAAAVATGSGALAVKGANGIHTYRLAPGLRVYRDGAPIALAALRPSDSVTVQYDATGAATRIDATSARTSPGQSATGARAGAGQPAGQHGAVYRGAVAAAVAGGAGALAVRQSDGTHTYRAASALQVYRDGKPSSLGALRPSDTVTVRTNVAGQAARIDAVSHAAARGGLYHGAVAAAVAAGASALAVKETGGTRTYRVAPGAPVYRDGRPSSLGGLKATDAVTGTTDAAGVTTRLDATSAPAPAAVSNPDSNPLLPALGALAVFLLLGFLLLARRRRRPTIVTTTTTATGAAVIPTLKRSASEPLRARLHDGKDLAE